MKQTTCMFVAALMLALTGCGSIDHIRTTDGKCLTCWNNPVTGEPINHDGSPSPQKKAGSVATTEDSKPHKGYSMVEHSFVLKAPLNVDIAYLRIKNEFNYYTEQMVRQEYGSMAETKLAMSNFTYDAHPNLYYRLKSTIKHKKDSFVAETYIEKATNESATIKVTYWVRSELSIDGPNYKQSLVDRYKKTLSL